MLEEKEIKDLIRDYNDGKLNAENLQGKIVANFVKYLIEVVQNLDDSTTIIVPPQEGKFLHATIDINYDPLHGEIDVYYG